MADDGSCRDGSGGSNTSGERRPLHIAVFPWLAFGHMIPFLELSKQLASKGVKVSYLSTPRNIDRLPRIPASLTEHLTLVKLPPLPKVDGLVPDDAEATSDLPLDRVQYLKKAFDEGLSKSIADFLLQERDHPVDWLLHDFAPYWLHPLTTKAGIPTAFMSIFNASTFSFRGPPTKSGTIVSPEQLTVQPEWIPFPSELAFRIHEARILLSGKLEDNASGVKDVQRTDAILRNTDALLMRSCEEDEGQYLGLLRDFHKKPVLPVGLLPPLVVTEPDGDDKPRHDLLTWMDGQKPESVVYVALGSEAALSLEMIHQLALGLELSGLPFLWALRPLIDLPPETAMLPEGFEDRVKGRGVVCMGMAPQKQILSHGAVGGFLTHSGWSSTIEALKHGIPLVLLPISADQFLVCRRSQARGVGLEVKRDENDGSFTGADVADALKAVMQDDGDSAAGGAVNAFKVKAREMQEMFGSQAIQDRCTNALVEFFATWNKPAPSLSA